MERITVQVKDVYGQKTIYPVCDKAKIFARLAGTKTLTMSAIVEIKKLGFGLVIKDQTL